MKLNLWGESGDDRSSDEPETTTKAERIILWLNEDAKKRAAREEPVVRLFVEPTPEKPRPSLGLFSI